MQNKHGQVALLTMQFSFANIRAIPQRMRVVGWETPEESASRAKRNNGSPSGIQVIERTHDCSLADFLSDLDSEGWQMVDATVQERINQNHDWCETYFTIRFTFAPSSTPVNDDIANMVNDYIAGLHELCERALWRVRVFSNPFYQNGEEIPGVGHACVNIEGRKPLYLPDGSPVIARLKNESGEPIGEPVKITPDYELRIVNKAIRLVKA
jgi:hypothetical protein